MKMTTNTKDALAAFKEIECLGYNCKHILSFAYLLSYIEESGEEIDNLKDSLKSAYYKNGEVWN